MKIAQYTDVQGFSWLVLVPESAKNLDSGIYLGPDWSDYMEEDDAKKVQNIMTKYKAYDMNTFLKNSQHITRAVNNSNLMRMIRHVLAEES